MGLGANSQDPLLLEVWPFFNVFAKPRGTPFFHSAQVFLKMSSSSRPWARSQSFCDAIHGLTSCCSCLKQSWWICKDCFQIHQYAWSLEMCTRSWADQSEVRVHTHAFLRHEYRLRVRHQFQVKLLGSLPAKSMCVGKLGARTDARTRACITRSALNEA